VNTGGPLTIAGAVGGSNTNLTIGGAGNTAISSSIATDSGTLTKSGAGTLTLSGNNSFTGITTINGGIVVIHADAALGTISTLNAAAITLNNGALQASETFTLEGYRGITLGSSGGGLAASATKTLSFGGVITGNNPLTINGAGQTGSVILTGVNGASTITISAGTLQVGSGGSTNSLGSGAITNNGNLVFNLSGAQTISQAISGTGTVEFAGTGAYTLSGTNSYQGLTTLTSGTLIVSNASALGSSDQGITVNGGILDLQADIGSEPIILNGGSIATSSGSGAFSGALTLSTNTSFDVAGGTLTILGVIGETGGSRSFTKTGNGTLILSNALALICRVF
jgi:fibronectin-binding autotransporter adhesin